MAEYMAQQTKRNPVYSRLHLPPICTMVIHLVGTLSQVDILKYIKMNPILSFPSRKVNKNVMFFS